MSLLKILNTALAVSRAINATRHLQLREESAERSREKHDMAKERHIGAGYANKESKK